MAKNKTLDGIIGLGITGVVVLGAIVLANRFLSNIKPTAIKPVVDYSSVGQTTTTTNLFGGPSPCKPNLMDAIAVKTRLKFNNCVTVTGTIVGEQPHYAPDGDMVFSLKLDPQFSHLVNEKNNTEKYKGGIWCEVVCVQNNKAENEPWHKGDCAAGAPFYKPALPKVGNRMKVTGIHAIDVREGGHSELHPVSSMQVIG